MIKASEAYDILLEDVIYKKEDLSKPENKWLLHCSYTATAAGRIAEKLGLDSNKAIAMGLLHDVGRKISHPNHAIEGYKYLVNKGLKEEAAICLTHSFIDNDINMTAGGGPDTPSKYEFIKSFLDSRECTVYDNIVQMCDLFCLETGFTTMENRLLDITKRKGVHPNSLDHFYKAVELKQRFDDMLGFNLYDLFPEIKKEDISRIETDRKELLNLLPNSQKKL